MRDRAREIRLVTLGLSPRDTHARCVDLARELDDAVRDVTARIDARATAHANALATLRRRIRTPARARARRRVELERADGDARGAVPDGRAKRRRGTDVRGERADDDDGERGRRTKATRNGK